ncbi:MAG: prepilin-type N-terminal cleavage/methylation domain-containing protein [Actinomycetota bacterium]|nr:prepilin-type N-terminal cleavage/methylation domain-containing protein [Actinomycetota bacterium]
MENEIVETQKTERGFTLVELLIVIVILGILATVTVFAVRGIADKGQDSACAADAKVLEVAVETYYANGGAAGTATEALLVSGELLRGESSTYDIGSDGISVTATAGGACAGATTT